MKVLAREKVFAHRGASYAAPENTLSALQLAIDEGAGGVEIDVRISHDLVPFLFHDDNLRRCGEVRRKLRDLSWDEIRKIDVGYWFSPLHKGEKIPDLIAALELLADTDLAINIELKRAPRGFETQLVMAVLAAIDEVPGVKPRILISSFEPELLVELKVQESEIPCAILYDDIPINWREETRLLDVVAIHANIDHITAAQVREIQSADYKIRCYTVNNPRRLEALEPEELDGIFSNCPSNFLIDRLYQAEQEKFEKMVLREIADMSTKREAEKERLGKEQDEQLQREAKEREFKLKKRRQAWEADAVEREARNEKLAQEWQAQLERETLLPLQTSETEKVETDVKETEVSTSETSETPETPEALEAKKELT